MRFYRGLLLADQLAENYWQCHERLSHWESDTPEHPMALIETVCDFIMGEKCFNLTMVMLLGWGLRRVRDDEEIGGAVGECVSVMAGRFIEGLPREDIPSNILIWLEIAQQLARLGFVRLEQYTHAINRINLKTDSGYGRIHYLVESMILRLMTPSHSVEPLTNYLPYRQLLQSPVPSPHLHHPNEHILRIHKLYPASLLPSTPLSSQNSSKATLTTWLTSQLTIHNLPSLLKSIPSHFHMASPVFEEEVVLLNYLKRSPEDNYFFMNHTPTHVLMELARVVAIMADMKAGIELPPLLFKISIGLLK